MLLMAYGVLAATLAGWAVYASAQRPGDRNRKGQARQQERRRVISVTGRPAGTPFQ